MECEENSPYKNILNDESQYVLSWCGISLNVHKSGKVMYFEKDFSQTEIVNENEKYPFCVYFQAELCVLNLNLEYENQFVLVDAVNKSVFETTSM